MRVTPTPLRPGRMTPMIRTGRQYPDSIRDGRQVWINGEHVKDFAAHPMSPARCGRVASPLQEATGLWLPLLLAANSR